MHGISATDLSLTLTDETCNGRKDAHSGSNGAFFCKKKPLSVCLLRKVGIWYVKLSLIWSIETPWFLWCQKCQNYWHLTCCQSCRYISHFISMKLLMKNSRLENWLFFMTGPILFLKESIFNLKCLSIEIFIQNLSQVHFCIPEIFK